jgi:hypothetical protein
MIRSASGRLIVCLAVAAIIASGCSDDSKPKPKSATPSPSVSTSPPAPILTEAQLKAALIKPAEISPDIREAQIAVEALKDEKAPMCSLSAAGIAGKPQITTRQFYNPKNRIAEVRYAQIFARYDDAPAAQSAFAALIKKARSCPKKQHIPPKPVTKNFTLFSHDDTWKVSEDTVAQWAHARGLEEHVEGHFHKYNVYHFIYDYAVRGNVLFASLYWERAEPKKSSDPIIKRATAILAKQLAKIG